MWILPKQLHTSPFVQDMTELGLDSEEFGQKSERSLMWRSKPSQQRTWSQRWKRVSWIQHLSGRILKHSQHGDFEDAWTSSVLDSRVNHSVVQEQEPQTTTQDTSGLTSDRQLDLFDHGWLSLRTSKESSVASSKETTGMTQKGHQYCSISLESWKEQVTSVRGEYSQRLKSEHPISESGCSSLDWRTPTVAEVKNQCNSTQIYLQNQVGATEKKGKNWATPNTMDYLPPKEGEALARNKKKGGCKNLREDVNNPKNWATPNARDGSGQPSGPLAQEKSSTSGKNLGQLNPDWVEQLMGLPVGWTDFDSSEME